MGITTSIRCRTRPASGIRFMFEKANDYQNVLQLGVGEPDFNISTHIAAAIKKAVNDNKTKYTPTAGISELREAAAYKLLHDNGIDCSPQSIMVNNGACEAIMMVVMGCTDPGDEVLLPSPGWPNYTGQTHMAGCKAVFYPLLEKDAFIIKAENLEPLITPKTRALVLNSPGNPTGGVFSRDALLEVAALVKRHNLTVISDEPYEKFIYDGAQHISIGSLPDMQDYVFTVNTCSKSYAMTGLRVGYVQGPLKAMPAIIRIQESFASCVNAPAQWGALAALEGSQEDTVTMHMHYTRRRNLLVAGLNSLPGVQCSAPAGAFYVFPNIAQLGDSRSVALKWLDQAQVVGIPGVDFGEYGEGHIRLCFAASEALLQEALTRLAAIV